MTHTHNLHSVLPGSCSSWQTRSVSLQRPLRRPRWTRCSSSPGSQSVEWLMEMADRGSACSTPVTQWSKRRTECTERQTHKRVLLCGHATSNCWAVEVLKKERHNCPDWSKIVSKWLHQIIYCYMSDCTCVIWVCYSHLDSLLSTHTQIQIHWSTQMHLESDCVWALHCLELFTSNDPLSHHGLLVDAC